MVSISMPARSALDKRDFRLLKIVQKLDLFQRLNIEEAQKILALCEKRRLVSSQVVWEANRASTEILLLVSGRLQVRDPQGRRLGDVLPATSVGEMGVITGHPRFVSVRAAEDSTALALNRGRFNQLAADEPVIYNKILVNAVDILAHRLTHTEHELFRGNLPSQREQNRW